MIEDGEVLYRFLHRLALACEIFCLVACICLVAKKLFRVFCHILQISQIMHVSVETCTSYEICSNTNDNHQDNYSQQWLLLVKRIIIYLVNEPEPLRIFFIFYFIFIIYFQHLRQIDEREHRSTQYRKSGKESEVLQEVCLNEYQSCEGTDGSETSQPYRFYLVTKHLFAIAYVFMVCKDVENITKCNAKNDSSDGKCQQRELTL